MTEPELEQAPTDPLEVLNQEVKGLRGTILGLIIAAGCAIVVMLMVGGLAYASISGRTQAAEDAAASADRAAAASKSATAELQRAREQAEADRLERSIGNCLQDNARFTKNHNALAVKDKENWEGLGALLQSLARDPSNPELQQIVKRLLDNAASYDENIVPFRDCTAAGIAAYNKALLGAQPTTTTTRPGR